MFFPSPLLYVGWVPNNHDLCCFHNMFEQHMLLRNVADTSLVAVRSLFRFQSLLAVKNLSLVAVSECL